MNGNPGIITNKNKNNNDYLEEKDFIINEIAGENNRLMLQIQIQMDKFMRGRVQQMANAINSFEKPTSTSGGSKKRSRPNKRVKTKKAKVTRKKQNKRLKKNKTLKKKNRRV